MIVSTHTHETLVMIVDAHRRLARRLLFGSWGVIAGVSLLVACADGTAGPDIAPQDPQLVDQGADLYAAHCAECHGEDLRGTDLGPSHLSIVYEPNHHGDFAFILAVEQGSPAHHWSFGDMAPVEGLTLDDVTAIIAFVREQQRIEGFEPYPP
jgi:mono/diheme cytochrome c family protein